MSKTRHNTLAAERRKARHYGMQALYQWLMAGAPLSDIEAEFRADYDFAHVDWYRPLCETSSNAPARSPSWIRQIMRP